MIRRRIMLLGTVGHVVAQIVAARIGLAPLLGLHKDHAAVRPDSRRRARLLLIAVVCFGLRREMIALPLPLLRGMPRMGWRPVSVWLSRRRCKRIITWMPASLRACTRWSQRTVRPSHNDLPLRVFFALPNRLYRISSGACTPRSAKPEANTCVLAPIRARRAAVKVPSVGLDKAQMWQFIALRPLRVKSRSQIIEIEGQPMRLVGPGRAFDHHREGRKLPDQIEFAGIVAAGQIGVQYLGELRS